MPGRVVHADRDRWMRLAAEVARRREALELRQEDAVAGSDGLISRAVWSILENARQKNDTMSAQALRGASIALGWPRDGCERVLDGEDPTVWTSTSADVVDLSSDLMGLPDDARQRVLNIIAEEKRRQRE